MFVEVAPHTSTSSHWKYLVSYMARHWTTQSHWLSLINSRSSTLITVSHYSWSYLSTQRRWLSTHSFTQIVVYSHNWGVELCTSGDCNNSSSSSKSPDGGAQTSITADEIVRDSSSTRLRVDTKLAVIKAGSKISSTTDSFPFISALPQESLNFFSCLKHSSAHKYACIRVPVIAPPSQLTPRFVACEKRVPALSRLSPLPLSVKYLH